MKTKLFFKSDLTRLRGLVVILLVMFAHTQAWAATGAITANKTIILPAGNTTSYTSAAWTGAGAPTYGSGTADEIDDMIISGSVVGSVKFYHAGGAGGSNWLQLKSGEGYIEAVITSAEGVDVEVYMKSNGASGTITAALTGASNQSVTGTTAGTKTLSTTSTTATLKITCASNAAQIGYIKITPKAKFTVTFYNAYGKSTPSAVTQSTGGASVTLPSALPTDDCASDGWEFAGWKTSSYQTSEVAYLNGLIPAGSYIPGGNESLYAVFRKAGDAASTSYTCESTSETGTTEKFTVNTAAGGYTITLAKGNSSNWYANTAPWRMYADGTTLTVSGSNPITSLALVHNSTYYASFTSSVAGATVTMASSSGGTTTVTKINANSITLTSGGSSQNRISSITVNYTAYTYKSNPVCTFDYFVDVMHENEIDPQAGTYTMPDAPDDATPGATYCNKTHYHFIGWLEEQYVNEEGSPKDGAIASHLITAGDDNSGSGYTADNKTFYAIWAEAE